MSNPNALFLLADHIKLSLLERQRAQSLNLDKPDTQDGHISRSLDQFREGLEALEKEQKRLESAGEDNKALNIADSLPSLQKQLDALTSQFHGFSNPATSSTLTHPNDPSLAEDFAHATTAPGQSRPSPTSQPSKTSLRNGTLSPGTPSTPKTVRFQDNPPSASQLDLDIEAQRQRSALFSSSSRPYSDNPDADAPAGYRDHAESQNLSNTQIHDYHSQILAQQDAQLDALGESIGRQRELSMQIGDELDSHVAMLDEADRITERHQGRIDRARRSVGRIARGAGESKQMVTIIVLIVILVLLIAVLK